MGPPSRRAADFLDSLQGADWTLFAGRPFHYHYLSWVMQALILADMPSMLVAAALALLLSSLHLTPHLSTFVQSYVDAVVRFILATGQWLLIGRRLEGRFPSRSS